MEEMGVRLSTTFITLLLTPVRKFRKEHRMANGNTDNKWSYNNVGFSYRIQLIISITFLL